MGSPSEQGIALSDLVVHRDEGVVWGEGPRGSLAVDEQRLLPSINQVFLLFSDVVGDVIDDLHIKVVWSGVERLGKCLRKGVGCSEGTRGSGGGVVRGTRDSGRGTLDPTQWLRWLCVHSEAHTTSHKQQLTKKSSRDEST